MEFAFAGNCEPYVKGYGRPSRLNEKAGEMGQKENPLGPHRLCSFFELTKTNYRGV